MKHKHERQMQLFIASVIVALFTAAVLYISISILLIERAKDPATLKPRIEHRIQPADWRPDIRHCFMDERIDLWDCIRNEDEIGKAIRERMLREDI